VPTCARGGERQAFEKFGKLVGRQAEPGELFPFGTLGDLNATPEGRHLIEVHQPGVVVLVPGKGQAVALDRVGDKAGRPVVLDGVEGGQDRVQVVAGEVGHQPLQGRVVVVVEDCADPGIAVEVALEMFAPALAALVDERRIARVRAGVDPFAQTMPVGPGNGRLQEPPVFQCDDAPAHHLEHRVDAAKEPVGDHGVEALAVVVDDPPEIADVVLPAFEQGLEDVALVELGIAGERIIRPGGSSPSRRFLDRVGRARRRHDPVRIARPGLPPSQKPGPDRRDRDLKDWKPAPD
jgi:hypothetical protein